MRSSFVISVTYFFTFVQYYEIINCEQILNSELKNMNEIVTNPTCETS